MCDDRSVKCTIKHVLIYCWCLPICLSYIHDVCSTFSEGFALQAVPAGVNYHNSKESATKRAFHGGAKSSHAEGCLNSFLFHILHFDGITFTPQTTESEELKWKRILLTHFLCPRWIPLNKRQLPPTHVVKSTDKSRELGTPWIFPCDDIKWWHQTTSHGTFQLFQILVFAARLPSSKKLVW